MAQWRIDQQKKVEQNSKTLYELGMIATVDGNPVTLNNPFPVTGDVVSTFDPMAIDAFGRQRMSTPLTLFDSFHRYQDNGKISEEAVGGSSTHNANAGLIECTIDGNSGSHIYRESSRVFAYQPGKSLLILETYVWSPHKTGLRQRYGYFDTSNGLFLEQTDDGLCWVERSTSTGILTETRVYQSDWNYDILDGNGVSRMTLDMTKAQIQFIDVEWLGLGSVRCGFVIDGKFILTHTFHHANIITSTYMATACLPVRAEIENVSATGSSSTLKVVCTSVISEGGYELRGRPKTAGMEPKAVNNYNLPTAGTYYPVMSIRLKSNRLGAIVIPKNIELVGTTASDYRYKIVSGATITGGTWVSAGTDSSVEYNINATSMSSGTDLYSKYLISTGTQSLTGELDSGTFKYQLERNTFTSTPLTFTLAVAAKENNDKVLASINWEEIT